MPTNPRQTHSGEKCPTVHYYAVVPFKPTTYHIECVTCPACLQIIARGDEPEAPLEYMAIARELEDKAREAQAADPENYDPDDFDPARVLLNGGHKARLAALTANPPAWIAEEAAARAERREKYLRAMENAMQVSQGALSTEAIDDLDAQGWVSVQGWKRAPSQERDDGGAFDKRLNPYIIKSKW